jgi:hypothetical protein
MRIKALLVAFAVLPALAGCGTVTPYAAKVNGERITVRDLERELKAIRGNEEYLEAIESQLNAQGRKALGAGNATFDSSFVSQVLTRRILLELVQQEVRRKRLRITDADRQGARGQLEQSFGDPKMLERFPKRFVDELIDFTAAVTVLQQSLQKDVTNDDVRKFYDENPAFFEQACFREAVTGNFQSLEVPPDQDAQARTEGEAIKARVDAGQDFAAIGQDRGCQPIESLPPTLGPALSEMQPGEVRGPIRSDSGYHVVQLVERKKASLEEAAAEIRRFLEGQGQEAFDRFVQEAVEKSDITVNPRYGTFDKSGPAVVPPQAPNTSSTSTPASVPAQR